ncbi:MAG: metallophosphoesterase family protein [Vicinamibacterales bacterium]
MKLWAISDLHVGYAENRQAVEALPAHPEDWLIIAGDTGETPAHLELVLRALVPRFAQIIWTPGNHDLWTPASWPRDRRGIAHYDRLVALCRRRKILTPEDDFVRWPGEGPLRFIVPTFVLFDYSFRPDAVSRADAVAWAAQGGVRSADEDLLAPDPYATRDDWCAARVEATEARLDRLPVDSRTILVNHFPLRKELAVLPRIPRFSIWCGTTKTHDWPRRYRIDVAVYGHLHLRSTTTINRTRFEEVSLGYPRQWNQGKELYSYLRRIL